MSSEEKKSNLRRFILFILLIAVGLFAQLYTANSIRSLTKIKRDLENTLLLEKDRMEDEVVELQKLQSEERIRKYAKENLGLIKAEKPFEKIFINNYRAKKIVQIVEKKYD